jgi:hypothetical protein
MPRKIETRPAIRGKKPIKVVAIDPVLKQVKHPPPKITKTPKTINNVPKTRLLPSLKTPVQ